MTILLVDAFESRQRLLRTILGLVVAALGVVVLLGWALDLEALKTVFPGLVTMKANTAAGLLLCGLAQTFLARKSVGPTLRFCIGALTAAVVTLGALTLVEYFFGWNLGIDQWLFRDAADSMRPAQPGRMSPSTAFCFFLAGSALVVASQRISMRLPIIWALGITLVVIGGMGALGQIANVLLDVRIWNYFGMALHTALGFVLVGSGLLALVKSERAITWVLDKATTSAFIVSLAIMLTAAGVSWIYTSELQDTAAWVSHTHEVLKEIGDVRGAVTELESSQRGYIILGDENLLAHREQSKAEIREGMADLRRLTADNPHQKPRLDQLEPLITRLTAFGEQTIALRRQQGFPAAQRMLALGTGMALSANVERVIDALRTEEDSLLVSREKRATAVSTTTFLLLPAVVFLSLATLSLALFFLNAGVAERERAEETSVRLAAIVSSSNDAIIGKDLHSMVTSWNQGAERIFGYTAQDMIGHSITRLIPPDRQNEEGSIIDGVKRGETVQPFDTLRVAKDGHLIDLSVTVSPIRDKAGTIIGASKVARDITARKKAEQEIRELNTRLEERVIERTAELEAANGLLQGQARIIDRVNDSIFKRDLHDRIDYWNQGAERMYGWPRDQAIGVVSHDLLRTRFPQPLEEIKAQLLSAGHWEGELTHTRRDGAPLAVASRWTLERDGANQPVAIIEINYDITDRKNYDQALQDKNAELELANRELEAFSYSVSHDLRSPLRAVDGFSQAVLEDYGELLPDQGRRDLQTVREGAQRMGRLIDDLLKFSRLGRAPLKTQTVDTNELVRHVLKDLSSERQGRQVELRVSDLPPCQGDPALLAQVWLNLISNAFKYSRKRDKAEIEIGSRQDQGRTCYFVHDNGAGFDMRYVGKLFGVFQRLHRADEFEGTGVGLAIVQRIIHRHGGCIRAEAEPDKGATFSFSLQEASSA